MKTFFTIGLTITLVSGLAGCGAGNGGGNYSPPAEAQTQPVAPPPVTETRSVDDRTQIDGLNGTTTKADDAAANSLPGNRTISGANGLDVTQDNSNGQSGTQASTTEGEKAEAK
jgi:predicted small lipoprotein YifL